MQDFTNILKNVAFLILFFLVGCGGGGKSERSLFIATSAPVSMIIDELTGEPSEPLAPPGASPHTFSPSPSDEARASEARALVYVAENSDGWADEITAKEKIKLIDMLPAEFKLQYGEEGLDEGESHAHEGEEGDHVSGIDPHFWMDPLAVKSILPALAKKLSALAPERAAEIKRRAAEFAAKLDSLNSEMAAILSPAKGGSVFTYHPSMRYLLKRYGLRYAGSIELSPGKEASPSYIAGLTNKIKSSGARSIFTEPQFPKKPAEMLADAAGVKLLELDPIGANAKSYRELLLQNARILAKGLAK